MKLKSLFQAVVDSFKIQDNQVSVAVSGGVDSIVLLHLMIAWAKKNNFPLPVVLTVDHKLRKESQKEAKFVENYAKELGAEKSFILNWDKNNIHGNVQAQARKARYTLLAEWCKNNNIKYLFVGHHKDDQAETFLLRLERGSGIDGLSSMDYKSYMNGICILRPLLNFSRSDIEEYAKSHGLEWVEDQSNQDIKYRRTLYRDLLKASSNQKNLTERISLAAMHMKRAAKALKYYTYLALNECVTVHDLGYIEIKFSQFKELPEEIALRVLLYSIMAISGKYYKPRFSKLTTLFSEILHNTINRTFSKCKIKKYRENILIIREASKIQEIIVDLPMKERIKWDNRFSCLIYGGERCSVVITPLKKTQKIPEFLKRYECDPEIFYSLPVVQKGEKILAYPYINYNGHGISNDKIQYAITCIAKENLLCVISL